jgi:hypothetical protein
VTQHNAPLHRPPIYFQSCLWVGWSVLFSTPSHIYYLTLDGAARPLCSLEVTGAGKSHFVTSFYMFLLALLNFIKLS